MSDDLAHPRCWTGTEYVHTCHQPSGRTCVERNCNEKAGTPWGPYWCPHHDANRLNRITDSLDDLKRSNELG